MATQKFRILRGSHTIHSNGTKTKYLPRDKNGRLQNGLDDIIESEGDLVAQLGSDRFQLVRNDDPPIEEPANKFTDTNFDKMTKAQLEAFAEEHQIDLEGIVTKSDMIEWIKDAIDQQ